MISGTVNDEGVPVIILPIAGQTWPAVVDTGFNGGLELPEALRSWMNTRFIGRTEALLASGQRVEEDYYLVDFPFDGTTVQAEASFVPGAEILVGTHLMRHHRLIVNFAARTVLLEVMVLP